MEYIINLENVCKSYEGNKRGVVDISLKLQTGCHFALIGPNGAGKSTLIRIMAGLSLQDQGNVSILEGKKARELQRHIGVVTQNTLLDPKMTVRDHLIFQGRLFGMSKKAALQKADELMSRFMLEKEQEKKAAELSGGNQRRLHCALALVHSPELLFLDEPTVGMDPEARQLFWKILKSLKNTSMIVTTQYLDQIDNIVDQIGFLFEGSFIYSGDLHTFKQNVKTGSSSGLEELYVSYIKEVRNELNTIVN